MKPTIYRTLLVTLLLCAAAVLGVSAQEDDIDDGPQDNDRPVAGRRQEPRINLLRQLGLSREQIRRIRRLKAERRPLLQAAQERFRVANRELDAAIYADVVNEEDVRARLKDVQTAHAELTRIRSMDELAVRRILNAEQLVKFRQLRARYDEAGPLPRRGPPAQRPRSADGIAAPRDVKAQTPPSDRP